VCSTGDTRKVDEARAPAASPGVPATLQARASARYGYVDLLRGIALVVMVETHVVNAYLPKDARETFLFAFLSFINGLVAPAFLFASGFSIVLQASRSWEDWLRFGRPFWINMRRLAFISLVAYYTHVQHFKLSKYLNAEEPDLWQKSLQVDILQCIVASLLVVQALFFLCRKRAVFAWGAFFVAWIAALLTPWVWAQDFSARMPLALALFLNPHGVSLFPLFPWICFVLAGGISAQVFLNSVGKGLEIRHMRNVFLLGLGMIIAGLLGRGTSFTLPGQVNFYTTSPLYVLLRLGCVLLLAAGLYGMERFLHFVPRPVMIAGQESLLVYGVHLWLIFAVLRGKHLGPILGMEAGYTACFLTSAAITALMLWLAGAWRHLKFSYPLPVKRAQAATVSLMILIFLLR